MVSLLDASTTSRKFPKLLNGQMGFGKMGAFVVANFKIPGVGLYRDYFYV